jgi:acyl-CoA reductase-like NAD-dependent aldehyde dehydrogenase
MLENLSADKIVSNIIEKKISAEEVTDYYLQRIKKYNPVINAIVSLKDEEEIFGPVLVIIPFENEAEAIKIANDTPYGLAAYMQTGSKERADRVARQLRAGAVHINGAGYNYGSPFGGYKQSGNGREGGDMGIEDYLETKTLHFSS